ncbi:MAG TPA: dockerin type I domain-containing protein, partial [Oligoflexia bacterium]|nr:dockerin type I domain-containing protein [Oligoflexia bacterium]
MTVSRTPRRRKSESKLATGLLTFVLAGASFLPQSGYAFTYVDAVGREDVDIISHSAGYDGQGGRIELTVGIDPQSPNIDRITMPINNALLAWNELQPSVENIHSLPRNEAGKYDFQTVLIHELGHALGLDHINTLPQYGWVPAELAPYFVDLAAALPGKNGVIDLKPNILGSDKLAGTRDDQRGDDINLNYFQKGINNPFSLPTVIDRTTFSRELKHLPKGHYFVETANLSASSANRLPYTQSLMNALYIPGTFQRALSHDDVGGLRFAQAGLDGTAGTADDYSVTLRFVGLADPNTTDIVITMANYDSSLFGDAGIAVTRFVSYRIGSSQHSRLGRALILFNPSLPYYFETADDRVNPWHNAASPMDVNHDGCVTAQDALCILNSLNSVGPRRLTGTPTASDWFFDVNGDRSVTALDTLQIVNKINSSGAFCGAPAGANAEGEASQDRTAVLPEPDDYATDRLALADLAQETDIRYGLYASASLKKKNFNANKKGNTEKLKFFYGMQPKKKTSYCITQTGEVYRWKGSLQQSEIIAALSPAYYNMPDLLLDASTSR